MAAENDQLHRYAAFISYRHKDLDRKWAKWLVRNLEAYRAPRKLVKKGIPQRIGTLFRDDDEIPASSDLSEQIQEALSSSEYLIVTCSPDTPKSQWVRKEIQTFKKLGKADRILALLVDGEPEESFPPELQRRRHETQRADGTIEETWEDVEPIASDVRPRSDEKKSVTERRALIRIAATLLHCRFDDLMQRDLQRQKQRRLQWGMVAVLALAVGAATAWQFYLSDLETKRAETAQRIDLIANDAADAYRNGAAATADGLVNEAAALASEECLQLSLIRKAFPGLADSRRSFLQLQTLMVPTDPDFLLYGLVSLDATFSHDGRTVVTGAQDGTTRVWDTDTGLELFVLPGHEDWVTDVDLSPDGNRLVTASFDGTARLWDMEVGKLLRILPMTESRTVVAQSSPRRPTVTTPYATFSPDGRHLLTTSFEGPARLWDGADGGEVAALGPKQVANAAFSPDGSLVMIDDGQRTQLWDLAGTAVGPSFQGQGKAFSPDGRILLTTTFDGAVRLWEIENSGFISVCRGFVGEATDARFTEHGPRILARSANNDVQVWDASTCELLLELSEHESDITDVAYNSDATRIVTTSFDGSARLWDANSGQRLAVIRGHAREVEYAAFSPDDRRIVTTSRDGTTRLWNVVANAQIANLGSDTVEVEFGPESRHILTFASDGAVRLWDAVDGRKVATFETIDNGIAPIIVFNRDSDQTVTTRLGHRAWTGSSAPSYQRQRTLLHDGFVTDGVFSPDGEQIATASRDGTARVWSATSGASLVEFRGHGGWVNRVAFSPDGRRIVTASRDLTARLWDVASGDELAILRGHTAPLTDVAFSPDGRRIVTASTNKVARLWDAISGQQQAVLQGLNIDPVTGNVIPAPIKRGNPAPYYADFSPDGRFIVTSSSDGIASIWDATSGTSVAVPWAQTGRRVHRASFNSNSRRIVTVSDGLAAVVWDMVTGEELMSLWGHEDRITDAAFSHDDRLIVTASDDRTARIWEASNGAEQAVLRGHEKGLTYAAFSPDSLRIVTSSRDDSGRIWDISGLQRAWYPRVVTEERRIEALFNKDGSRIITTADGSVSRLWDTATGNELTKSAVTFEPATAPDEDPVNGSTYGIITETLGKHSLRVPDAVCGNEGFVIQVDKSGLNTPPGGSSLTYSVSPDGQLIITTSWGGQVRLWDSIAGIEVAAIGRDDEVLSHSGFNPNGSRIITNAQGGEAWLWDLDKVESASEQLIRLRLGASSRLTEEEREISNLPPDDLIIDLSERLSELNPDDHINFGRLFSLGESGLEKDFSKALYHQAVAVIILESLGRADEAQQQRVLRANLARVVETEQLIDSWSMIGAWMAENGVEEFVY